MTIHRIDAAWAAFFGLSPPAFLRPGIQVVAHQWLADYQGVWLFRHHASLCLSVPPGAEGLEAGFVVLYQTLLKNAPSVALATGLGYQIYATHLVVQLTSEDRVAQQADGADAASGAAAHRQLRRCRVDLRRPSRDQR